jgi:galactose mutarotase-like enzyme
VSGGLQIGGAPVVRLEARDAPHDAPAFVSAEVLPGRGMMLLQARLRLPGGEELDAIHAPSPANAARALDGGPGDAFGNASFSFGGALLAPFANRITGRPVDGGRCIETVVDGHVARLPCNWGGKAEGARRYAMHGLILDSKVRFEQPAPDRATGRLEAGDFGGRWPSRAAMSFEWRLASGALELEVAVRNAGEETLPFGLGWHPYFALPSGDRAQARLRLPAALRAEVDNYDEVLPTGRLVRVEDSPYDFNDPEGRALAGQYLDDCFTDLGREQGWAAAEIRDPAAGLGLRIASPNLEVKAMQVYAPPDQAFVVVEPQFNLADPYSSVWPAGVDTGMARLAPGAALAYRVRVQPFALGAPVAAPRPAA